MPIDYTKRPSSPPPPPPPPPTAGGGATIPPPPPPAAAPSGPVVLTKAAPSVSLTKGGAGGVLRVNLNWNARPAGSGGFFKKNQQLDLDLGCLWEFTDGTKGVVQALGNAFTAQPFGMSEPVIKLDGDDRSGASSGGENMSVNLAHLAKIKRILVFALIYEGAANWAAANGVVTLFPARGEQVQVHLDDPRDGARICAIAMLENTGNDLVVHRLVNYINGGQRLLDETYNWGMRWTAGRK